MPPGALGHLQPLTSAPGPFKPPPCALCISNVGGMSTHTSDPRCRRPPPAPVPVSDGQKAISPNHSHPGPGWLPSRPAAERRVKAACVWCGSSRFIHRIALDLRNIAAGNGDESQVGSEMSRRRFFRGTNLTGHLCF